MKKITLQIIFLGVTAVCFAQTTAGKYKIDNLEANSRQSDFGTSFYGDDGIIFSSSRKESKRRWKGNNQSFLDLYEGEIQNDGSIDYVSKYTSTINSKYHESSVAFDPVGNVVYFTRNNYLNNKLGKDKKGVTNLAIYKATIGARGSWKNIKSLPFNSRNYSVGHPAISNDGTKLYFTSDMPGSYGLSDIYVVDILGNDEYSEPRNLGKNVNSTAKEMFPFIDKNNILYFSSNSTKGFGGLDIYAVKIEEQATSRSIHLGRPINSEADDFSYILDFDRQEGYFSSNREGGKGDDDIYHFVADPPLQFGPNDIVEEIAEEVIVEEIIEEVVVCEQSILGIVKDKETGALLSDASIKLLDEKGKFKTAVFSDTSGAFTFDIDCNSKYTLKVSKSEYDFSLEEITTKSTSEVLNVIVLLKKTPIIVPEPVVIPEPVVVVPEVIKPNYDEISEVRGKIIVKINPIFFALNSDKVRDEASYELEKVVALMRKYPNIKIEAGSHTDSRGSSSFNNELSGRRASSTMDYIIKQGIDPSRISAKGYGETQLANECANGVKCKENQHQQNRRSEFEITNPEALGYY